MSNAKRQEFYALMAKGLDFSDLEKKFQPLTREERSSMIPSKKYPTVKRGKIAPKGESIMADKKPRKAKAPTVDFSQLEFQESERPLAKGAPPAMLTIHTAVLNTYGEGRSISMKAPSDVNGFLMAFRQVLRKNGHKERVAYKVEGITLHLWAEDPRVRKSKKAKLEAAA